MPVASAVSEISARVRNEGDCKNERMMSSAAWSNVPLSVMVARFAYSDKKRADSSAVSGRRNARWPKVSINCFAQALPSPLGVQGIAMLRAAGFAITCAATAVAAAW